MKFNKYLKQLNDFAKANPESLKLDVVYSGDNAGNSYHPMYYSPSMGNYKDDDYTMHEEAPKLEKNAICIN